MKNRSELREIIITVEDNEKFTIAKDKEVEINLNGNLLKGDVANVVMDMNNFYYPEVVDFHANKKQHVVLNIDKDVWVGDKQVHVDKIRLSIMPFNILIYSIGLHVEHVELSQMFSILNQLRQINSYDRNESVGAFVNVAIQPVRELYALLSGNKYERNSQLVENGNKLKIFQVVLGRVMQ